MTTALMAGAGAAAETAFGALPAISASSFWRAILSFNVSLMTLALLFERGRDSSGFAASGVAVKEAELADDGDDEASSASRFARAIFSFRVSLPALLSDLARIGESASNEAEVGVDGAAAAASASFFCRAIFSLRVSLPELLSALPG
jgi:hypothetical protein